MTQRRQPRIPIVGRKPAKKGRTKRIVPPVRPSARRKRPLPNVIASKRQQPKRPRPLGADETIALRRERALEFRADGLSYRHVARKIGVSLATAYEDVQAELFAVREHTGVLAEQAIAIDLRRLDRCVKGLMKKITRGDAQAVGAFVRVSDRRAKLLGLDAPTKIAPTDPTGTKPYDALTDDELKARIAEMAKQADDESHD